MLALPAASGGLFDQRRVGRLFCFALLGAKAGPDGERISD